MVKYVELEEICFKTAKLSPQPRGGPLKPRHWPCPLARHTPSPNFATSAEKIPRGSTAAPYSPLYLSCYKARVCVVATFSVCIVAAVRFSWITRLTAAEWRSACSTMPPARSAKTPTCGDMVRERGMGGYWHFWWAGKAWDWFTSFLLFLSGCLPLPSLHSLA